MDVLRVRFPNAFRPFSFGGKWRFCPQVLVVVTAVCLVSVVRGQANYDRQAISITYEEDVGLPLFGTLNGTVTELDQISSSIVLNKTKANLNCSSGFMSVSMQFQGPFYGIVYADYDRNSACKIVGRGQSTETIDLPLKGCGTLQSPARVFTNNIVVRFHRDLEIDGDEVITIICRYPPPIVPPPVIPALLQLPPPEVVRALQPLREFEILLIICAIMFLALMLLGIGCSYYCLKKRNIHVVRKRPASSLGSEVTKMSEPVSMFGGLKIPRAHADDTSGSDEQTESVRSEFPSELASSASEDDYTSAYSDVPFELAEGSVRPVLRPPPPPGFDVKTTIRKGARPWSPANSSKASSESELILKAQEQYLTTILERTETNTLETLERVRRAEAAQSGPPPVHARVRVADNRIVSDQSEFESESEYSQVTDDFYHDKLELSTAEQTNFSLDMKQRLVADEDAGAGRGRKGGKSIKSLMTKKKVVHDERLFQQQQQDLITPVILERATAHLNVGGGHAAPSAAANSFDVLIRILDNASSFSAAATGEDDDVSSVLTEEERFRLLEVIMHDEKIQTVLKSSSTTEKILQLRDHRSIERIIEPQKWDVLIRILDNNAEALSAGTRDDSSKSSHQRSSMVTGHEARSMSEVMVDFSGAVQSSRSSTYTQGARSAADRSATEIVEADHFLLNREEYFATSESFHRQF